MNRSVAWFWTAMIVVAILFGWFLMLQARAQSPWEKQWAHDASVQQKVEPLVLTGIYYEFCKPDPDKLKALRDIYRDFGPEERQVLDQRDKYWRSIVAFDRYENCRLLWAVLKRSGRLDE